MRAPLESLQVDEELLALVPRPSPAQRQALKASLEADGQLVAILILPDKTIVDGYSRRDALLELGMRTALVQEVRLQDRAEIVARVVALNVHRRHLSEWQRAKLAVQHEAVFRDRAARRREAGQARGGRAGRGKPKRRNESEKSQHAGPASSRVARERRADTGLQTRDEIAQAFGLGSHRVFEKAKLVLKQGKPSEIEELDQGRVPLGQIFNAIRHRERAREHARTARKLTSKELGGEILHGDGLVLGPEPGTVDLVVLDPPWGVRGKGTFSLRGERRPGSTETTLPAWDAVNGLALLKKCLLRIEELLRPGGSFYVFCASRLISHAWDEAERVGLRARNICYWYRPAPAPHGRKNFSTAIDTILYGVKEGGSFTWNLTGDAPNVIEAPSVQGPERTQHETQKPESVYTHLIEASSLPGDLVCDFMAGSGTTGAVCQRFKRRFVLVEREASYVAMARGRLAAALPAR